MGGGTASVLSGPGSLGGKGARKDTVAGDGGFCNCQERGFGGRQVGERHGHFTLAGLGMGRCFPPPGSQTPATADVAAPVLESLFLSGTDSTAEFMESASPSVPFWCSTDCTVGVWAMKSRERSLGLRRFAPPTLVLRSLGEGGSFLIPNSQFNSFSQNPIFLSANFSVFLRLRALPSPAPSLHLLQEIRWTKTAEIHTGREQESK